MYSHGLFKVVLSCALLSCGVTGSAQVKPEQATAQIVSGDLKPIHPGDNITLRIKLNDPLPPGARFDLRLSPVTVDQELDVGQGEPIDRDRTEFLLKTTLPKGAYPGEWHIKVIYLFLAGTGWTSNTLRPNDLRFTVRSAKYQIPSSATVTLEAERH